MNYLRNLMTERGLTLQAVADAVGVTKPAVAYWAKGNLPSGEKLEALCEFLDVHPSLLQYGATGIPAVSTVVDEDTVSIPVLNISGSCGGGALSPVAEVVKLVQVAKSWIYARSAGANLKKLHIINACGDSMSPLIKDGDFVIVDTSKTEIRGDGVYAIQCGENTFIKRIQLRIDGSVSLLSENPQYETETICRDELSMLRIIGRCIIACNVNDL